MQLKHSNALKLGPRVSGKHATPGVAPLVDIVFLLICFYLFVMQSIQSLDDSRIQLPTVTHVDQSLVRPAEIVINLRADGTLVANHQVMDIVGLGGMLRRQSHRAAAMGGILRVVIRADHRQTFGELDEIMGVCRDAGIQALILRAREE